MLVLYPTSLLLFAGVTLAFPDGAPSDTCLNMYPKHKGMEQQDTVPPFDITLSSNLYIPGQTITVNISAKQGHAFRGIQMRAHRANMGEIVGTFISWPRDKLRPINCFGISNSMLTHTNNAPVTSTVVEWRPPEHNLGTLIFTFTLLEEFQVFWYGIQSTRLESANSSTDLLSSVQPETNISFGQIEWSLCGETKGCLLYPRHCSGADCYSALTFSKGPDGYTFELMGEGEGYVSVGFSHDRSMGGEHTITCTADGNRVTIQSGYNHKELFNERLITTDLKNLQTKQEDGKIYCRFTRQEMMNIVYSVDEAGHVMSTYSDLSIDYYVFLASGYTYHNSDVMKIHTELPIITDDKVDFKHYAVYYGGILPVKTKVHAALMVVAWMGMAGLTAVLARHFRNGCGSNYILGVQLWFHLHRLCALLAFGLTVTGLVLILVSLEGKVTKDTAIYNHACVGFTVCALVCAQILLGLLRPSPDFRFRYVFNYAHRILGKIAQILSAVTLMLAFQPVWMPRVMRQFGVIVVAVWIAVQVVAEVLLEVWHCYTNRRTKSADIDLDGEHSDEQLALPDPSSVPFLIYLLIPLAAAIAGLCSVLLF